MEGQFSEPRSPPPFANEKDHKSGDAGKKRKRTALDTKNTHSANKSETTTTTCGKDNSLTIANGQEQNEESNPHGDKKRHLGQPGTKKTHTNETNSSTESSESVTLTEKQNLESTTSKRKKLEYEEKAKHSGLDPKRLKIETKGQQHGSKLNSGCNPKLKAGVTVEEKDQIETEDKKEKDVVVVEAVPEKDTKEDTKQQAEEEEAQAQAQAQAVQEAKEMAAIQAVEEARVATRLAKEDEEKRNAIAESKAAKEAERIANEAKAVEDALKFKKAQEEQEEQAAKEAQEAKEAKEAQAAKNERKFQAELQAKEMEAVRIAEAKVVRVEDARIAEEKLKVVNESRKLKEALEAEKVAQAQAVENERKKKEMAQMQMAEEARTAKEAVQAATAIVAIQATNVTNERDTQKKTSTKEEIQQFKEDMKKSPTHNYKYECVVCDYYTDNKKDYNKHCRTRKHKKSQCKEIYEEFVDFNDGQIGTIASSNLGAILEKIGRSPEEANEMLKDTDPQMEGALSFEDFLMLLKKKDSETQALGEGPDPKVIEFLHILDEYRVGQAKATGAQTYAKKAKGVTLETKKKGHVNKRKLMPCLANIGGERVEKNGTVTFEGGVTLLFSSRDEAEAALGVSMHSICQNIKKKGKSKIKNGEYKGQKVRFINAPSEVEPTKAKKASKINKAKLRADKEAAVLMNDLKIGVARSSKSSKSSKLSSPSLSLNLPTESYSEENPPPGWISIVNCWWHENHGLQNSFEDVLRYMRGEPPVDVGFASVVTRYVQRSLDSKTCTDASYKVVLANPTKFTCGCVTIARARRAQASTRQAAAAAANSIRMQAATLSQSDIRGILDGSIVVSGALLLEVVRITTPGYVDMNLKSNQINCNAYLQKVEVLVKQRYPSILRDCYELMQGIKLNSEYKDLEKHISMADTEVYRGGFVRFDSTTTDAKETEDQEEEEEEEQESTLTSRATTTTDAKETEDQEEEEDEEHESTLRSRATNDGNKKNNNKYQNNPVAANDATIGKKEQRNNNNNNANQPARRRTSNERYADTGNDSKNNSKASSTSSSTDILFEAPKKGRSKEKVVFCTKEHQAAWDFGKASKATYVALLKNTSFSVLHESPKDVIHVIQVETGYVAVVSSIEECVEAIRDYDNTPVLFRARVDAVGKACLERISVWKECDGEITDKPLSIERTTTKANDHVVMCSVQERWSRTSHQLSLENGFKPTLEERLIAAASVRRITNLMKALSAVVAVQNNSRIAQIVPVVEGGTTLTCWQAQHDDTLMYGTKCWSLTGSLYRKTQYLRAAEHKEIIEVHLIIAKEYLKQATNYNKDSYNFFFLNQMGRLINEFVVRFVN